VKRTKRRYIAVQLDCDGVPAERELLDAVWASITRLYGEVGASLSGLALISFDGERKVAVFRVNLVSLMQLRASLTALTSVAGAPVSLHVLAVSGTLKALYAGI
jgi:ribonuclease P/MRP protein subunit POP5